MRSSSSRLRAGAALATTGLALVFALGSPAFGADNGQGAAHRSDRSAKATADGTTVTEDNDADGTPNNVVDDGDNLHPSGKDRSVENGGSGDQGNSASTPDQDGHGPERDYQGTDKPGGPGGIDVIDQDRNNGCGNDDDFEDDNEGWCGHKPKAEAPAPETPVVGGDQESPEQCADGETMPAGGTAPEDCVTPEVVVESTTLSPGAVLGTELQAEAPVALAATPAPIRTEVMGISIERGATEGSAAATGGAATSVLGATFVRGAALARTGAATTLLVLLAAGLLLAGYGLQRAARRTV